MKFSYKKYFLVLLSLIISCSSSVRFIQLAGENGKSKLIYPPNKTCFLIVIDSLQTDSSLYRLFTLKKNDHGMVQLSSYWYVGAIDTIQQGIEFKNCRQDTLRVFLRKEQIRCLSPSHSAFSLSVRQTTADLVLIPALVLGVTGVTWGLISLPFPSTPWQDDLKLIRGGVIALGIFGLATLITEPAQSDSVGNKYRIESLH